MVLISGANVSLTDGYPWGERLGRLYLLQSYAAGHQGAHRDHGFCFFSFLAQGIKWRTEIM
jgi:hypothetical protein